MAGASRKVELTGFELSNLIHAVKAARGIREAEMAGQEFTLPPIVRLQLDGHTIQDYSRLVFVLEHEQDLLGR